MNLHTEYYKMFGLSNFWLRLSLAEEDEGKFVDEPELWQQAETLVSEVMEEVGIPYEAVRGEAAFYGPKIDFQVTNVVGREETASTNQMDLVMGRRFGLKYTASDSQEHTPIIIHRAPLGTHERFVAFLIEHYGGAFPTWMAPVQVRFIPVASAFNEYAFGLNQNLYDSLIRSEVDDSHDSFSKKIRNAAVEKIPNILIVGENEQASQSVTWQRYGSKTRESVSFEAFSSLLHEEINKRLDWRDNDKN
jgi:threonyl-tRNA synthetase